MTNRRKEIVGILLMVLSILVFLSLIKFDPMEEPTISDQVVLNNYMGIFGVYVAHYLIKITFGWGALVFPVLMALTGFWLFTTKEIRSHLRLMMFIFTLGFWMSILIATPQFFVHPDELIFTHCGLIGGSVTKFIHDFIGLFGLIMVLWISIILIISSYFKLSIYTSLMAVWQILKIKWKNWVGSKPEIILHQTSGKIKILLNKIPLPKIFNRKQKPIDQNEIMTNGMEAVETNLLPEKTGEIHTSEEQSITSETDYEDKIPKMLQDKMLQIDEIEEVIEGDLDSEDGHRARFRQYRLPSIELLEQPPESGQSISIKNLRAKGDQLIHALETFGVRGNTVRISPGPVITLYEIEPNEGVRVNKFTNLSDDLARIMKAQRIRVIAPIPGSKTVGIELPNENPEIVYLKTIINSEKYINSESMLTIAIGKTTKGDAFVTDLAKMPHLLIAGATGSGKSVCINTLIMSILYKAKPEDVKFIMIDPKKLELFTYKTLEGYHLITSQAIDEYVMTSPENAVEILNSALVEMERRYSIFANATVRNITEYNQKALKNSEMEKVPLIVVVIDELADLMITAGKDVEEPITRLAQMARAVGIHLVVATQRPSVDVITGLIKANFPARIAFQVTQKVDSRTIIDQMGAEKLLGNGDMLFVPPGASQPRRLHNAFVTLDELEAVMEHIKNQPKPDEIMLPQVKEKGVKSEFMSGEEQDEYLLDAAKLVIRHGQASVSLLQRRFRIGYARAGRLIDELEALGVVAGYSGSKARDVLVDESYLETLVQ